MFFILKIELDFKIDVVPCETSVNGWILWLYSAVFLLFCLYSGDTFSKSDNKLGKRKFA